jgi:hypothetical protein
MGGFLSYKNRKLKQYFVLDTSGTGRECAIPCDPDGSTPLLSGHVQAHVDMALSASTSWLEFIVLVGNSE